MSLPQLQTQGQEITIAMECFNTVLLKLREVHEREVEGWQVKIQELSNKKGCDSKRMEELFSKNQQMKVQQGMLTENIRTLENRLRAGLCDRCTVTQEVAKKRQQEFEASHIQSIQHISVLMTELTNLKRENHRLREEMGNFRAALKGHNNDHSSNSSTTTEVKANSSPAISPSFRPEALVTTATSRAFRHPADGDVAVKSEADRRTEEAEHRQWSGMNRSHYAPLSQESNELLLSTPWKTEHGVTRGDKRARSVEGLTQLSTIPPQALLLKNVSSITGGEVNRSRHVLHAPVPCRPQAIKSSPVTLPWPLSESSEWGAAAAAAAAASGTSQVVPPSLKHHPPPRYPNLIPTGQHASPMRQVLGSLWNKQGPPRHPAKEPTVLFRLKGMLEHEEAHTKPQETLTQKEIPPTKAEKVSEEGLRDASEGPLDLSDCGKSKSSKMPRDYSPSALRAVDRVQSSPDNNAKTSPSSHVPVSSPSPTVPPSSSTTPAVKYQEVEPIRDHNHEVMLGPLSYKMNRQRRWADGKEEVKRIQGTMFSSQQVITEQEEHEEVNGKTEQSDEKKVPVLTISLRPVVLLESLNSALKKQESLSSNGKSPVAETESSSEEQGDQGKEECESEQESNQSCKRKRASVETETDRDSDTENVQRDRKIKITARTEKSPS